MIDFYVKPIMMSFYLLIFLDLGNVYEEVSTVNRLKPKSKIDYKADFVTKLEKEEEEKRREESEKETGEKGFIPFRFQEQYEDEETGLYYNRFRYYSPEDGCYTQQNPIGLVGGNPTIYGYVKDTNWWLDPLGLLKTVDFTGHQDLFPHPKSIVQITMTGSRKTDFVQAYKISGISSKTKGYTWHHVYDFNPTIGKTTMQLVKTKTHVANLPHKGSVSQFEKEFGVKYETYEAKQIAYEKGWHKKAPRRQCH